MIRSMLTALAIVLFILLTVWSVHLGLASRMSPAVHERAWRYLAWHREEIPNQRYLTVIDFTKPSYAKRMFIHDLETGEVQRYLVAHGENSGYIYTTELSNQIGSHQSCRGLFLTGQAYDGDYGPALRLHGLEEGMNDNAYRRDIVIHGASWVSYGTVFENGGRLGRSWGCPAVPLGDAAGIVEKLKGGSLLYIHAHEPKSRWARANIESCLVIE